MNSTWIEALRRDLGLSQAQFGQLFGAHSMTVSRWERGLLSPTDYQQGLMLEFRKSADVRKSTGANEQLGALLVSLGIVGVILLLLQTAKGK